MGSKGAHYDPGEFDEGRAREVEEAAREESRRQTEAGSSKGETKLSDEEERKLQEFLAEVSAGERDREVERVLGSFKLNPYEHLDLNLDAGDEEVRRAYRKLSLMVHPDKCSHPNARKAFEALGVAQRMILEDKAKRAELQSTFERAKESLKNDFLKEAKEDQAAMARRSKSPKEVWEQEFVGSPEFHRRWKAKAREMLTENEWRRRRLQSRMARDEEQAKLEYQQEREQAKRKQEEEEEWEKHREERVGGWRRFMHSQRKKRKKGKGAPGEFRPPPLKAEEKVNESAKFGIKDYRRVERPDEVTRAW